MPHELRLQALDFWIDKRRDLIPQRFSKAFIIESAKFIIENNNFIFDTVLYKQLKGTAMGTKFAPSYTCVTVEYLGETRLFSAGSTKVF